jgi:hypothetical protein
MLNFEDLRNCTETVKGSALDRIGLLGRTGNILPLPVIESGGALRKDSNIESQENISGKCYYRKGLFLMPQTYVSGRGRGAQPN